MRVRDGIRAVAQRLKAPHRLLTGVGIARPCERRREVVRRGGVVRFRRRRRAKQLDGLVELALLQEHLPEIDLRRGVIRIDLEHTPKRRSGVLDTVVASGDEAEHERRLRTIGQCGHGRARFGRGLIQVAAIEQRDRQVEMREPEVGVDLQRLTERVGRGIVVELLEVRDAQIVGPVGALEPVPCRVRRLRKGACEEQHRQGNSNRTQHHGVVARMGVELRRPLAS